MFVGSMEALLLEIVVTKNAKNYFVHIVSLQATMNVPGILTQHKKIYSRRSI